VTPSNPPSSSRPAPAERGLRRLAIGVAFLPALAVVAAERWAFGDLRGFPLDDPWIHLVFARHLAAGDGLAYRAGHLVAGSTAPLWTAVLSVLAWLPGPAESWAQAAGIGLHLATLLLTFRVARRFGISPNGAALSTLLVGLTDGLVLAAPSGMEIPLFTTLFLAGLLQHLAERRDPRRAPVSFLLWALAALTRPEALLLLPLAAADRLIVAPPSSDRSSFRDRLRSVAAGLGVSALLLLPIGGVFVAISGSPLPTTFAAKSGGAADLLPPLRHLAGVLGALFAAQPVPTLLAAGGLIELLRRRGSPADPGLLLPAWTIALPVSIASLSGDGALLAGNFGRYLFPALPGIVLLGVLALEPLAPGPSGKRSSAWIRRSAIALLLVLPAAWRTARAPGLYLAARDNVRETDGRAAAWLAENAAPDALVATLDIGVLGWGLPNPLLDLGGIVDPERRERFESAAVAGEPWQAAILAWLAERRPEYVVVFPRWLPQLDADPRHFPALLRLKMERNVAMGGDELVVYGTPWKRTALQTEPSR